MQSMGTKAFRAEVSLLCTQQKKKKSQKTLQPRLFLHMAGSHKGVFCFLFFLIASAIPVLGASKVALVIKNLPVNAGDARDMGWISGLGRPPGEGAGYPLQYSHLGNHMDRGAWHITVHGVSKSKTRLATDHTTPHSCISFIYTKQPKQSFISNHT